MGHNILSLNIGEPKTHVLYKRKLYTGFIKEPVQKPVWLTRTGFEGDGQADLKNHGGEDKALLIYTYEHYRYWEERYNQTFELPAFGENITIEGLPETDVYIGDVYKLGEAVIQVSQPRNPCYKIAEVHQIKDIPAAVTETGFSGYYFRVLKEGYVAPKGTLELIEKDVNQISISYVHQSLFHHKDEAMRLEKILNVDSIAANVRDTVEKRLKKLIANKNS